MSDRCWLQSTLNVVVRYFASSSISLLRCTPPARRCRDRVPTMRSVVASPSTPRGWPETRRTLAGCAVGWVPLRLPLLQGLTGSVLLHDICLFPGETVYPFIHFLNRINQSKPRAVGPSSTSSTFTLFISIVQKHWNLIKDHM